MSCNDAPSVPCYVCWLWAARLNIEGAQVQAAVYRQGTHPQLFSQGEGLAIVGFCELGPQGSRCALLMIRRPFPPLEDVSLA